jgi:hypothetical protein
MKGEEAAWLTSLVSSPSDYETKSGQLVVKRRWWESGPHPLLSSVLPDVQFCGLGETDGRSTDASEGFRVFALRDNRLYAMDALNRLLLDAGFTFDSTEMPAMAKIAVLFATFGRTRDTSILGLEWWRPTSNRGFPAITFLSAKRGERRSQSGLVAQGVRVDCLIDGVRNNVFVQFVGPDRRGLAEPERVMGRGIDFMVTPIVLPDRKPDSRRGEGQGHDFPTPDAWVMNVSGGTWGISGTGHFGDIVLNWRDADGRCGQALPDVRQRRVESRHRIR